MIGGALLKNPGLKLLAFVIALALWVLVAGEEESVRVYSVPIDFTLSKDRILVGDTPGTVQVRLRGSEAVLRRISPDDLSVPIDLSALPPGQKGVESIAPRSVLGVPSGAAVELVTPDRLQVMVERKTSRSVELAARFEGSPPPGYRLVDATTDPDQVTLEGPEGQISQITLAYTDPIPLQGRRQSFMAVVGVTVEDPRIRVLVRRPVKVAIRIEEDRKR